MLILELLSNSIFLIYIHMKVRINKYIDFLYVSWKDLIGYKIYIDLKFISKMYGYMYFIHTFDVDNLCKFVYLECGM